MPKKNKEDKSIAIYLWTVFICSELFAYFGLDLVYSGGINNYERFLVGLGLFILGAKFWILVGFIFAGLYDKMISPLVRK
jgi:hypothetical protein